MYPQRELTRLAAHKAALQRDIALGRSQCTAAGARLLQPLAWLDRVIAFSRRVSPLALIAAVPLGFLLKRSASPRAKLLSSLVRWGPLVIGALRGIGSAVKTRFESARRTKNRVGD